MSESKEKPIEHMTAEELQHAYDLNCAFYGDAMMKLEQLQAYAMEKKQKIKMIGDRLVQTREMQAKLNEGAKETRNLSDKELTEKLIEAEAKA